MLGADREQDLLRRHEDAAARQQQGADLLDELRIVVGEAVARPFAHGGEAERLARAFPPIGDGKEGRVDLAVDEGVFVALPVARLDDVALGRGPRPQPQQPVGPTPIEPCRRGDPGVRRRGEAGRIDLPADEIAAALPGDEEAFLHQILIGERHGVARDLEGLRQLAAGGQRAAGRQLALADGGHQHLAQLGLQGGPRLGIEVEELLAHR